jgi:hypothetical protein
MSEKQKAEAKAKRDAEKAPKAKPAATAKPEKAKVIFNSEIDQEEKALFRNHHLPNVRKMRKAVSDATNDLRRAYKAAKAEGGFTKADFDTAFAVETAENEARERAKIARQLRIAKIMGSSLGAQLDMFLEPDRTPAVDIAYQEGWDASLTNKKGGASPKYDPSTEQFRRYMAGFHEHQATLAKGIGKLEPDPEKKVAAQKAEDEKAFDGDTPSSGVPMTRAQFKASQEALKAGGKPN